MAGRLPDFLIVGSPKCGTTSLAFWLRDHPQAFVPEIKELNFFNLEERWSRGLDWYAQQFAGGEDAVVAGEATPAYMFGAPNVERIARALPNARLIVCLRDPADRAYSHWHDWRYRQALEWRPFGEAIEAELSGDEERRARPHFAGFDRALGYYVAHGHYLHQLERLCRHVPREHLHVVLVDDLERRPRETFAAVCRFLGIDDGVVPERVGSRDNPAVQFRPHYLWRQLVRHKERLPPRVATWLAMNLFVRREVTPAPMHPDMRARLREHFAAGNARLGAWLGRDLSAWGYPAATGTGEESSAAAASSPSRTL